MKSPTIDLIPYDDFESASRGVLAFLQARLGFDLWMMTRTEQPDWIVLQAQDRSYAMREGTVLRWADSFCSRMVRDEGPRIAPSAANVPVYAAAPIARQVPIGAYIGMPVTKPDGSLFGTLCAIDPNPQSESILQDQALVEMMARLLGTVLANDLRLVEQQRLLEQSMQLSLIDPLTGLINRRGWDEAVTTEEARARRYGTPMCALIVDLDELKQCNDTHGHTRGDELLKRAAKAMNEVVRETDKVARIGGDEFGILALECGMQEAKTLQEKLYQSLAAHEVEASVGMAVRDPAKGLRQAIISADRAMYTHKRRQREQLNNPDPKQSSSQSG